MNAITLDTLSGPFIGHGFGDLHNRTLRSGIWSNVLAADERDDGSDVDDFAGSTVGKQVLGDFLAGDHCRFDIHVQHEIDVLIRELGSFTSFLYPCAVQQDIA